MCISWARTVWVIKKVFEITRGKLRVIKWSQNSRFCIHSRNYASCWETLEGKWPHLYLNACLGACSKLLLNKLKEVINCSEAKEVMLLAFPLIDFLLQLQISSSEIPPKVSNLFSPFQKYYSLYCILDIFWLAIFFKKMWTVPIIEIGSKKFFSVRDWREHPISPVHLKGLERNWTLKRTEDRTRPPSLFEPEAKKMELTINGVSSIGTRLK